MIDLFGKERIIIPDNPLLAGLCNHILDIKERKPEVLNGETVGEIDRNLIIEVWKDEGVCDIIPSDKMDKFAEWMLNKHKLIDPEAISRARRYLAENDKIRLPQKAVLRAEQHRQRIARSVR